MITAIRIVGCLWLISMFALALMWAMWADDDETPDDDIDDERLTGAPSVIHRHLRARALGEAQSSNRW